MGTKSNLGTLPGGVLHTRSPKRHVLNLVRVGEDNQLFALVAETTVAVFGDVADHVLDVLTSRCASNRTSGSECGCQSNDFPRYAGGTIESPGPEAVAGVLPLVESRRGVEQAAGGSCR